MTTLKQEKDRARKYFSDFDQLTPSEQVGRMREAREMDRKRFEAASKPYKIPDDKDLWYAADNADRHGDPDADNILKREPVDPHDKELAALVKEDATANLEAEGKHVPNPDFDPDDRRESVRTSMEASMSAVNDAQKQVNDELAEVDERMQNGDGSPQTVAKKESLEEEKQNLADTRTLLDYKYHEMGLNSDISQEELDANETARAKDINGVYENGAADTFVEPMMDNRTKDTSSENNSEQGEGSGENNQDTPNPENPNPSEGGESGGVPEEEWNGDDDEDEPLQDIEALATATETVNPPESPKTEKEDDSFTDKDAGRMIDLARRSSGFGSYFGQMQTFMSEMNMFESQAIPGNLLLPGPTFITRPRLNLQGPNIVSNALLAPLATMNELSLAFGIRAWLDTNLWNVETPLGNDPNASWVYEHKGRMRQKIKNCPFVTDNNPFFAPLCNALTSISGFPNPSLQTESTEGGYFGEGQSWISGGSLLAEGNYNLSLEFMDIQGSPILSIFKYWMEFMRCLRTGEVMAYADDIDANRLCYTVSIYQFIMEPGYKYIAHYCKCTGCFPSGDLPLGSLFSKSKDKHTVQEAMQFSIPFTCNVVEYDKPHILTDFNHLVTRYNPTIAQYESGEEPRLSKMVKTEITNDSGKTVRYETNMDISEKQKIVKNTIADQNKRKHARLPYDGFASGIAIPFITSDRFGYKLEYRFMGEESGSLPIMGIGSMTEEELKAIETNMMIGMTLQRDSHKNAFGPGFGLQYPEFYKKLENEKRSANAQFREFIQSLKNAAGTK